MQKPDASSFYNSSFQTADFSSPFSSRDIVAFSSSAFSSSDIEWHSRILEELLPVVTLMLNSMLEILLILRLVEIAPMTTLRIKAVELKMTRMATKRDLTLVALQIKFF